MEFQPDESPDRSPRMGRIGSDVAACRINDKKSSQIESMGKVEKPASAFVLAVKKESLLLVKSEKQPCFGKM